MARTNIEETAFKRVYKLAEFMGCSSREALGTVALLWAESQEVLQTHGTKQEIIDWAGLSSLDDLVATKWISCMIRARFISEEDGRYLVRGNETQIEGIVSKTHTSAKGGEATKRKWEKIRAERGLAASRQPTPSPVQASLELAESTQSLGTIQSNAIQGSAKQDNSTQEPSALGEKMTELISVWGETLREFKITADPKFDEMGILRLLRSKGFEQTRLALIGARFEEPTKTFSPAKHCTIARLSRPEQFEKCVKLGSQEQSKSNPSGWVPPEERGSE